MNTNELRMLEYAIDEITEIAQSFGLDFYPMHYEICPADIIYTFGAYGIPTRFHHWKFGKIFNKMKRKSDLGLHKIYELVINTNPCYAFLLEGNSLIQNKLLIAHVLAHCDFFKNNIHFSTTNRNIITSMSATAECISKYEMVYGIQAVEKFIDAIFSIQEHIDPTIMKSPNVTQKYCTDSIPHEQAEHRDDLWHITNEKATIQMNPFNLREKKQLFPPNPAKDIVGFIQKFSPILQDWQRDIIAMLRDEMIYFWPQLETKIMNEGWASYWHQRIMRELDLTSEETIEYAKLHSAVIEPSPHNVNSYALGLKLFENIRQRWDQPTKEEQTRYGRQGGQGYNKIFEVRALESDQSFLRNYLTKEIIEQLNLYIFEKQSSEWKITDKSWRNIRTQLIYSHVNGGFPYLVIEDGDYRQLGELYVTHQYEEIELDVTYIERTLPYVFALWGKPVHLQTNIDSKHILFTYDGQKVWHRFI